MNQKNSINYLKENKYILILLLVATVLRFYHLDFQSIWMDEIYTMNVTNPDTSFATLISEVNLREGFPYLYFILIKTAHIIFDYSPVIARSFSAIMGILSVYYIYKLGKELFGKKAGLLAALLLTFSEHCIYLSQEARPYTFYLLAVILSFYGLVLFIKNPTLKNAIKYGLFAGLLLNTNFFGFVNLFSQALIVLFYLYILPKNDKVPFLKNALIAAVIALVLFIPNYYKLTTLFGIKSSWIPAPTNESFSLLFKEFLGNSEITLFMFTVLFLFFFFKTLKEKDVISYQEILSRKNIFSFTILLPWLLVYILVLFVKSYLDTSLMVSRYFTSIIPVLFLILGTSIQMVPNRIIRFSVALSVVSCMWINMDIVKKYYDIPSKSQFRETSQFVINNNKNNEPVYTSLTYWYNYFLVNETIKTNLIEKSSLETLVNEMTQNPALIKPFWYIDAHNRPFTLSEPAQKFINENFYIENNFDGYDAWGKHFVLLKDAPTMDISKFNPLKQTNGDVFQFNIESFENKSNSVKAIGWAYFDKQVATKSIIEIAFVKNGKVFRLQTQKVARPDVTTYFKSDFDLSNAGFLSTIDISSFEAGKYQLAIYLLNKDTKKEGLILTDKFIDKI